MSTFTQEQLNELQELIKNVVGSNFERRSTKKRVHEDSNNSSNNSNVNVIEPLKIDSMPLPTHMSFNEFIKKPDDFKEKLFFNDFKKLSDEEIIEYMEHMIRGLYAIGALHSYEAYNAIFIKNLRDTIAYQHSSSKSGKFLFKENHYRMVLSFFGYKFHMRNEEVTERVSQADVYNSLFQGLITMCNGEHLEFTRPKTNFNVNKPRVQKKKKNADDSNHDSDADVDHDHDSDDSDVDVGGNDHVNNVEDEDIFEQEEEEQEEHDAKRRRVDDNGDLTQVYYDNHTKGHIASYEERFGTDDDNNNNNNSNNAVIQQEPEPVPVIQQEPVKKAVPIVQKKTFTLAAAPYLKSMLPSTSNATTNATPNPLTTFEKWEPKTVDRTLSVRIKNGTVLKYSDWKRDFISNKKYKPAGHYDTSENIPKYQPYVEFQQSNGEWVDLETYYVKFIKSVNGENVEGKSFDNICAMYKFFKDKN